MWITLYLFGLMLQVLQCLSGQGLTSSGGSGQVGSDGQVGRDLPEAMWLVCSRH